VCGISAALSRGPVCPALFFLSYLSGFILQLYPDRQAVVLHCGFFFGKPLTADREQYIVNLNSQ
jgi:hypothetical protein